MSRIAKQPVVLPTGVECKIAGQNFSAKGKQGELSHRLHELVKVSQADKTLEIGIQKEAPEAWAIAGTTRAVIQNIVRGVHEGFEKKLVLIGVGYRADARGPILHLTVGFSHPVEMLVPKGLNVTTPTQTEIIVSGADKQLVGQFAANVRAIRPPEPYKGKGIRYFGEYVEKKETKKK